MKITKDIVIEDDAPKSGNKLLKSGYVYFFPKSIPEIPGNRYEDSEFAIGDFVNAIRSGALVQGTIVDIMGSNGEYLYLIETEFKALLWCKVTSRVTNVFTEDGVKAID